MVSILFHDTNHNAIYKFGFFGESLISLFLKFWCFIEDLSFNKLLCLKICFCNNRFTKFIENVLKCFHRINQLLSLTSLATALYWGNINEVLLNTNYSHTDYLAGLFIHLGTKWWIFGPWLAISLPLFISEMEMVCIYWFYAGFYRIFYKFLPFLNLQYLSNCLNQKNSWL